MTIHYEENQQEKRARLQSTGDFAANHDWFLSDNNDGSVTVMDYATNDDGLLVQEPKRFTNFDSLLAWAGY